MTTPIRDYHGVIHVHTDRSGGEPVGALVAEARRAAIDFLMLTDRHARGGPAPAPGAEFHGGVLVVRGEEVYAPDGHFLVFGLDEVLGDQPSVEDGIRLARERSGWVVGIHYHFAEGRRPAPVPAPTPMKLVEAVEAWCFLDEFLSRVRGAAVFQFHARPERALRGPAALLVREWDREQLRRPVPAIGCLNAHRAKQPLLDWREFFPAQSAMRTIRTAVKCLEWRDDPAEAATFVRQALSTGRSYIYNRGLGPVDEFRFEYHAPGGGQYELGGEAVYEPGGRIVFSLPREAEVVLRKDGQPLCWTTGDAMTFPAVGPGVYRLEARLERRTWIIGNAIRIVPPRGGGENLTTIDFT